jgi:hypothetical protein
VDGRDALLAELDEER